MNRRRKMVQVGTVKQLNCYPVKSCSGVSVDSGLCTPLGLKVGKATDRHWLVVRSNGDFVTQRQFSKLALVSTEIGNTQLVIQGPGMPTLRLPLEPITDRSKVMRCRIWGNRSEGLDCGDDAAYWFSTFLRIQGLRLLFSASDLAHQDVTNMPKPGGNPALPGDQAAFSDWCSYLVTTEESLAAVNERLKEPVVMRRFRPNIVVSGGPAFDEDNWSELQIGDATFRMLGPCERCLLTTVNPDTEHGPSPLFGVNATVDVTGVVKVGDPVFAIRK
nr:hypothetical protein BaRGS_012510 [Batillaria attramentaria]